MPTEYERLTLIKKFCKMRQVIATTLLVKKYRICSDMSSRTRNRKPIAKGNAGMYSANSDPITAV